MLNLNGAAVGGSNDLTFTLYNAVSGGTTVGTSNVVNDLVMTNGLFTVTLDFEAGAFDGTGRWLQIAARPGASAGAYTNLAPRTSITPTPYAVFANTASNLSGALPAASLSGTYGSAVNFNNAANQFSGVGSNLTALNASQLTGGTVPSAALNNAWRITGNTNTTPGTHFLGTTDNQPFDFRVNNQRGFRLEYQNSVFSESVNVIGGYRSNQVSAGIVGATISGGGSLNIGGSAPNRVTGDFGTVGGGSLNTASGGFAATVGGGQQNTASGDYATVPGGLLNTATNYAFAAGNRAKATNQGSFVWADSQNSDFASTANNQFLIRASGGVGINANNPGTDALYVNGTARFSGNVGIGTANPLGSIGYPSDWNGLHTRSLAGHGLHVIHGANSARLHLRADNNITNVAQDFIIANGANQVDFLWLGGGLANRLQVMTIATNGNVGLGTSTPTEKLHVAGNIRATGNILADGNLGVGTTTPATTLDVRSATPAITVGTLANADGALYLGNSGHGIKRNYFGINDVGLYTTAADVYLSANGTSTSQFVVKNNGNVGIGTANPAQKLTVNSPGYGIEHTDGSVRIGTYVQSDGAFLGTISPHPLILMVNNGSARMTVTTNGNVGIGTSTPATKLDVAGEVTATAVNITSDRNAKEQFKPVNAREVLAKVVGLPITEWQYKTQSDARHIGPMAQDFREAFALGRDEKHITSVDADGVALAAIQGLNEVVREQREAIEKLATRNRELEERLAGRLATLEKLMEQTQRQERP